MTIPRRDAEIGMFTLSLDFELIWGTRDKRGQAFRRQCERERSVVIDRLLTLLASYDISATWCVLGHLFLDHCLAVDGRMHPEIVPPHHSWVEGDWFVDDPGTSEQADPIYYGRSLVTRIPRLPYATGDRLPLLFARDLRRSGMLA